MKRNKIMVLMLLTVILLSTLVLTLTQAKADYTSCLFITCLSSKYDKIVSFKFCGSEKGLENVIKVRCK